MSSSEPIKVQVRDPKTDELLQERVIENDYVLLCAGNRYVDTVQAHKNGTQVITVKVDRGES